MSRVLRAVPGMSGSRCSLDEMMAPVGLSSDHFGRDRVEDLSMRWRLLLARSRDLWSVQS